MIQDLINAASPGDTVIVPAGTYEVDAVNAPIMLKSSILLDLSAATLQAKPNNQLNYKILWAKGVENITVLGGKIVGERDKHLAPIKQAGPDFDADVYEGGWGMGVSITDGSKNIKVLGTYISRCFGDGIYVDWGDTKQAPTSIVLDSIVATGNRRQGASIICVNGIRIRHCTFGDNGNAPYGTIPGAGIDFECDLPEQIIKNVIVEGNNRFHGNRGSGIGVNGHPGTYSSISILPGNYFDMRRQPIWVAGGLDLGTPWWAFLLNRALSWDKGNYRWWGYPTNWSLA